MVHCVNKDLKTRNEFFLTKGPQPKLGTTVLELVQGDITLLELYREFTFKSSFHQQGCSSGDDTFIVGFSYHWKAEQDMCLLLNQYGGNLSQWFALSHHQTLVINKSVKINCNTY